MATKMLSVGLSIEPATKSTLVITPLNLNNTLTVGVGAPGNPIAIVSGGVKPYTVAPSAGSAALPNGLSFTVDNNGNIFLAGTPTEAVASNLQILLDVSDSSASTVTAPAPVATAATPTTSKKKAWGEK